MQIAGKTSFELFTNDNKVSSILRQFEWQTSGLGPPDSWPAACHALVKQTLASKFPTWIAWRPDLNMIYNDAFAEILGEKHPSMLGARLQDIWAEIWDEFGPLVAQALAGDAIYLENSAFEIFRHHQLEKGWFTFSLTPIQGDHGETVGIFCVAAETTRHVLAERRQSFLLQLQERLHSLAAPREVMMATAEMLGQYLDVDRCGYAEIDDTTTYFDVVGDWTKGDMESLVGRHELENFGVSYIAELRAGRLAFFDDAQTSLLTQDDVAKATFPAVRTRAAISVPLLKGGHLSATLYLTQIEPRIWTEQEKLLAQEVAERTWAAVERARAELDRAHVEEELRKRDKQKDVFLAMLAHELRNPLAPISAAAELLKLPEISPKHVRTTSEVISRQVDHMTGLINDLLDVSRVRTGFVVITKEEVDISKVISDALEQVRPIIESRHHRFSVETGIDSSFVLGDHKRLVQVLANLLNNAAKYTPEGGSIKVKLETTLEEVVMKVSDTGIGISKDLLPHLFKLFSQAERTSDRSQGGLGIGLALVKNLVELHSGRVTASSGGENSGSEFKVSLPRFIKLAQQSNLSNEHTIVHLQAIVKHLMIVDDNVDAAQMLAMFLQAKDYQVTISHDPYKALELAEHGKFDVYLLDIGLPGIDGNELARRLRELPYAKTAKMIAITGYGNKFDRESSIDAGFDEYVVKPANPVKLIHLLEEINKT